jgi:mannosyl-oligosaccharide alpha-1,2-mannosidase
MLTPPSAHQLFSASAHRKALGVSSKRNIRSDAIVEMTLHAWSGYYAAAAGHDELEPLTNTSSDRWGEIGITPIDSIDTLLLMGLSKEYHEARELVKQIDLGKSRKPLSFFETTIRHLGGSLSAYAASGDTFFLHFAKGVADGLLHSFEEPLGLPAHQTAFGNNRGSNHNLLNRYILAEVGSNQLEFRFLSKVLNDPIYREKSERFTQFIVQTKARGWPTCPSCYTKHAPRMPHRGLWPTFISPDGRWSGAAGYASMMDSFHEYLLKQWILFNKRESHLLELYEDSVEGMLKYLLRYTKNGRYAFLGYYGFGFDPTMDHLACFAPGMLALGVMHHAHDWPGRNRSFSVSDVVAVAKDLAATCYRLYENSKCGLAPDVVEFTLDGCYQVKSSRFHLRPETVESLFYLFRLTEDPMYQEWGWNIARAINASCRTPSGFSGVESVTMQAPDGSFPLSNRMESYFIAETLKYLFLLFSDEKVVPLDKWVLTTEGHLLPVERNS